ncbi:MAG: hypothetical protein HRU46_17180 [Verrucomicrobiales bacterium]|nr:hypothetical protein [Verrucomicrobiales bacterium]
MNYWPMVALGGAIASFFLFIDAETRIERLIGVTSGALGLVVGAAVGALLAQRLIKWPEDLKAGRGTARLVISGGDYRADRFEPDCIPVLVVDRCGAWRGERFVLDYLCAVSCYWRGGAWTALIDDRADCRRRLVEAADVVVHPDASCPGGIAGIAFVC